jgi:hypothetical protein
MTSLPPEPAEISPRSPAAKWGAAHLAWGVAIFLALLYAAQQWPAPSHRRLEVAATVLNVVGLLWIALSGWCNVQQGWSLRRPTSPCARDGIGPLLLELLVGLAMTAVLMRGAQSRIHISGLERLAAVVVTIASLSILLQLLKRAIVTRRMSDGVPSYNNRWDGARLILSVALTALIVMIELLPL